MFTLNIIKAVREKMGEAMNATVRITGGHLDLSDVSEKTILFVAIGTGEKSCNSICSSHFHFSRVVCCLSAGGWLHLLPCRG